MEFSVEQIAAFLHGEVVGDGSIKVNNLSKIDDGKPGTLSFLANSKYTHHIYDTNASAVLVRRDFTPEQEVKTNNEKTTNVTISLGVSTFPQDGQTSQDLIKIADERLYKAKENGRNQVGK